MNKGCKNCEHREWRPAGKPYGMGFQWCNKYNEPIADVKACLARLIYSNSQESIKKKDKIKLAAY